MSISFDYSRREPSAADPEAAEKSDLAKREEEILDFWRRERIFERSLEQTKGNEEFVFYDGPPFATGLPHYGHLIAGTIKDVIPRYQTMRGKHVPRRWGWDCHGLPVENIIEDELNLGTKKDIEEYGIARFNEAAREAVLRYTNEWREIIPRTGRWVDMDDDYRTMDPYYTDSVWWSFKTLYEKDLIYKGFKSMHICPRCATTLSNFEVTQGYEEIKDLSVTAKFELEDEPGTYLLAWTTTPWTLPGNVALAVSSNIQYSVFSVQEAGERVIIAKELEEQVLGDVEHEYVKDVSADELIGRTYKPVFDYYTGADLEHKENAWQVYAADFVTTDEGTGIVHIAPAFGADDLALAQEKNLPMIQHVTLTGEMKEEVTDFAGLQAKPKGDPMATDVEVVKNLAHRGLLFAKEKITHSYPHCWRCDTPLLNYAADSWFVKATQLRDALVAENENISWVPPGIGAHRFRDWLENVRDWAISRSRYWGAPLPVWRSEDGEEREVLGSREDLYRKVPDEISKLFIIRHAESEKNTAGVYDSSPDTYGLTEEGEREARATAAKLKEHGVEIIYTSPIRRAKETAQIIANETGAEVRELDGIRELDSGAWDGMHKDEVEKLEDRQRYLALSDDDHYEAPRGETGESWREIEERAYAAICEAVDENPGKVLAFISHQGVNAYALKAFKGWNKSRTRHHYLWDPNIIGHAVPNTLYVDRERRRELDFHRPYIDRFTWHSESGKTMARIPEVFDCWYESGSMPFASSHYPVDRDEFDPDERRGFPANFIAEGLDQTRGWFYSMLVLGVGLFGEAPYKNVVVNGTVLAEDGSKMSKRKKNYPNPMDVVAKYGADAMRYYMMSSPAVRSEDLNFSEKGVEEVRNKVVTRLLNVVSFYEMYADSSPQLPASNSSHVLDRWIIARLNELIGQVTTHLDSYEIDKAARPIAAFVDDLSAWYLRRSRERIKGENGEEDKEAALATTKYVLTEFSKITAPFMPFVAEDVYRRVSREKESVHLEQWLEAGDVDTETLNKMTKVRELITQALDKRTEAGIKVRQPLQTLYVPYPVEEEYAEIVKEEVNVKEVKQTEDDTEGVKLDTNLEDKPKLKDEGAVRELLRAVQDLRKKAGLQPGDEATLIVSTDEAGKKLIESYKDEITSTATLSGITFGDVSDGKEVVAHEYSFVVSIG